MKNNKKQRKYYRRNSFGKPGAAILQLSATFQCDDDVSQSTSVPFEISQKKIFSRHLSHTIEFILNNYFIVLIQIQFLIFP